MQFRKGDSVQVASSNGRTKGEITETRYAGPDGGFEIRVTITQSSRPEFIGKTLGFMPNELEKI